MKVGIVDLLFVVFLGLKLAGFIDWSWWWVFSPYIVHTGLIFVFAGVLRLLK